MFSKTFLKVQAMAHAYFVIKIPFSIARNDTSNKWSQVKNDTWKGNYTAKSRYWGEKSVHPLPVQLVYSLLTFIAIWKPHITYA